MSVCFIMTCAVILPAFSLETFDGFDCKDNTEEEGHLGVKGRINHKSDILQHAQVLEAREVHFGDPGDVIPVQIPGERKKGGGKGEGIKKKKLKAFYFTYAFKHDFSSLSSQQSQ